MAPRAKAAWRVALCLHHRLRPTGRAAPRGAALQARRRGLAEQVEIVLAPLGRGPIGLAALLGFEDEGPAFVAVDAAEADGAVAIVLEHPAFEHIIVLYIIGAAAVRWLNPDQLA